MNPIVAYTQANGPEPLPDFPLFPNPIHEGAIEPSAAKCDICRRARGFAYTAGQYGDALETGGVAICPWCIADGSAGACGIRFNDTTVYPIGGPAQPMNSDDRELVERRPPGFVTWQASRWLACCGRACVYLGEDDSADLRGRWSAAVPSMFAGEGRNEQEIDQIVEHITRGGSLCAYDFQCQVCRCLCAYWDCD